MTYAEHRQQGRGQQAAAVQSKTCEGELKAKPHARRSGAGLQSVCSRCPPVDHFEAEEVPGLERGELRGGGRRRQRVHLAALAGWGSGGGLQGRRDYGDGLRSAEWPTQGARVATGGGGCRGGGGLKSPHLRIALLRVGSDLWCRRHGSAAQGGPARCSAFRQSATGASQCSVGCCYRTASISKSLHAR